MVRSEGSMSLKNPVTPPGIDPGTVRLLAQGLNRYPTPGPSMSEYEIISKEPQKKLRSYYMRINIFLNIQLLSYSVDVLLN